MRRRVGLIGHMLRLPLVRNNTVRRCSVLAIVVACGILGNYPQKYRAAMSLTPADPASLGLTGLGSMAGQLGSLSSVFGNQSSVEVSMRVGQSAYVRGQVDHLLHLDQRLGMSQVEVERWLDRKVDVRSMRGGIVMFEMQDRNPDFAREIIAAYGEAVRQQLTIIARKQTADKRKILEDLVTDSSNRLTKAQAAYDSFRLQSRYSAPQSAIRAIGDRIPSLEASIKAKQVQLNAQRQFATDENMKVRQILAEIDALNAQLAEAKSVSPSEHNSVGRVVHESTEVDKLRRELDLAQSLYDNYTHFLQNTSVEDLTATANVRVLEPAYVDPERQHNWPPIILGLLILVLELAMEFYLMRPPLGEYERGRAVA